MTIDEMLALPDDGWMYELIQGVRFRVPHKGNGASMIGVRLAAAIGTFVDARELGAVTGASGVYNLTCQSEDAETGFIPTVAFVRAERVPPRDTDEYAQAWPVAPDLVIEVVSPSQYRPEMAAKARRYLDAGVRLIWMVWPKYQQVDIWRTDADEPVATLSMSDTLDGMDVLPGFAYPITRLFR